jgi:DNA invertase Pin-like site-specific DNA recombinase
MNCRTRVVEYQHDHSRVPQGVHGQQSVDQQHDAIAAAGITPDRVFTDTASGRAGSSRPAWTECMGYLREGDHLVVVAVDRLGRSVREVATALHELTSRGVHVRSLREGVDTSTPTGRAVTSIMATIAELELELGKERRAASREARVARGLAATKPMKLGAAQQKRLLRLYEQGEPVSECEDKQSNVGKKALPKHRWPAWWEFTGTPHPDVPFPKFSIVHGDYPDPDEILGRATLADPESG